MFDWLRKLIRPKQPKPTETKPSYQTELVRSTDDETDQQAEFLPVISEIPKTIIVRGERWKNTAETRRDFPLEQGTPPDDDVESLVKQLGRIERAEYRRTAAEKLGLLGQVARPAIPELVMAAVDLDKSVRDAALCALNQIDPGWKNSPETLKAVPGLVKALQSQAKGVPEAASRMLVWIGPSVIPELIQALATEEDRIDKIYAIRVLAKFGPHAEEAVPELSRALCSAHLQERMAAADALLHIGRAAEAVLPSLVKALSDPYADCRVAVVACLANLEAAAAPAAPALILLLADRASNVRQAAATALEKIGPKSIPVLVEFLQMRDLKRLNVRYSSLEAYSAWAMKPAPDGIVVDLQEVWENLGWWIDDMIGSIEKMEYAQQSALGVLGKFGPAAETAIPTVAQALADPKPGIKLAAIQALGQIGPKAKIALPELIEMVANSNRRTLDALKVSLENIDENWRSDPAVLNLVSTLAGKLSDPDIAGNLALQTTIWIGAPAVPDLIDLLHNGDLPSRVNAAFALGQIGKDAALAIPDLTKALQDPNQRVQTEAESALQRINSRLA